MMPFYQAVLLIPAIALLLLLTGRLRLQLFVAVLVVALLYGASADMAMNYIGHSIATGFAQTLETVGLVVVGSAIVTTFVERSGAARRLAGSLRVSALSPAMLPIGYVAGLGGSALSAYALLSVLPRTLGRTPASRAAAAATLGLALLATHGMLMPAPVPVIGAAILRADGLSVLLIGAGVAAVTALAGWIYVERMAGRLTLPPAAALAAPASGPLTGRSTLILLLPVLVPAALLILQSVAQIPTEPLGRGATRETITGFSRPLFLMVASVVIVAMLVWRWDAAAFAEDGWFGEGLRRSAGLILLVGLAGGFTKVLQNTGMPELLGERMLDARIGILLPFLLAAAIKTLQGSSLVAAITAAGMLEPILPGLGLTGTAGPALAVVAIGAGSIAVSHVNDVYFWLVADAGGLTPRQALLLQAGGSAVQAIAAALVLVGLTSILV